MKKLFFFFSVLLFAGAMSAQHVSPLNIQITEVHLDSLRAKYSGSSYLLELQRLERLLKDDTKALKDATAELKAEKDLQKQIAAYIKNGEQTMKSVQQMSDKELNGLKKLKEVLDKQIRTMNSSTNLDPDSRNKMLDELNQQQKSIDAAIEATNLRQKNLADIPTRLQKMSTDLLAYNSELTNKETDIKQMEATIKARREIVKSEMKAVKAQGK